MIVNYVYMSNNYGQSWNVVSGLPSAGYWSALSSDSAGVNMVAAQDYSYYGNIIKVPIFKSVM